MTKRAQSYGMDQVWTASDGAVFMAFSRLCGEQARAIFAWDMANARGAVVGPRPAVVPASEMRARAEAFAAST